MKIVYSYSGKRARLSCKFFRESLYGRGGAASGLLAASRQTMNSITGTLPFSPADKGLWTVTFKPYPAEKGSTMGPGLPAWDRNALVRRGLGLTDDTGFPLSLRAALSARDTGEEGYPIRERYRRRLGKPETVHRNDLVPDAVWRSGRRRRRTRSKQFLTNNRIFCGGTSA